MVKLTDPCKYSVVDLTRIKPKDLLESLANRYFSSPVSKLMVFSHKSFVDPKKCFKE